MASCANCGAALTDGARFCAACGAPTASAERNTGARTEVRESRRVVSVLFADVVGSTELAETIDAEAVRRHMSAWFVTARRVIERHGGTIEKFIGDAVMAVFGVPVLHEDDALRAARAAVELRDADHGPLTIRIGLTTGEVVAGDPGTGQTFVTGDAVNTAARLQSAAMPGTIVIDEATHRRVRDLGTFTSLTPLELKGKQRHVPAFRLETIDPLAQAITRRLGGPMVGRADELGRLQELLAAVQLSSSTRVVTVLGEAGIGKSRLVHEFVRPARRSTRVIRGACLPYGEGITYWPIRDLVRDAAGFDPAIGTTPRAALTQLLMGASDSEEIVARLAPLVGPEGDIGSLPEVAWAVRRLLEHLASRRPVVIVLDDIQWAEPTLIDLIDMVSARTTPAGLLIVCMARPELVEVHPGWRLEDASRSCVRLSPLTVAEGSSLVKAMLGGLPLDRSARDRIAVAATGNALYIEQLVAMLIDDGVVGRDDGRWVALGDLATLTVPPSIAALLAARIDRLPEADRMVLERASVIGQAFDDRTLGALLEDETSVDRMACLAHLVQREFLVAEDPMSDNGRWRFRHLLLRDAAYEGLSKVSRAVLHERLADWLELSPQAATEELGLIVGYHFEQAHRLHVALDEGADATRLAARAISYLHPAGLEAAFRGDVHAASALLRRVVDLCPPSALRADVLYDLGAALWSAGDIDGERQAEAEAATLLVSFPDPGVIFRMRLRQADAISTGESAGRDSDVLAVASQAITFYEAAGDAIGLLRALQVASLAHFHRGDLSRQIALLERYVDLASEIGAHGRAAFASVSLAIVLPLGPTPVPEAIARCRGLLDRVGENREAKAEILLALGLLEALDGKRGWRLRFDEAKTIADDLELLLPLGVADYPNFLAIAESSAGSLGRIAPLLRWSVTELERLDDPGHLASVAPCLAEALLSLGQLDEAETIAKRGREVSTVDDVDAQVRWRAMLALVAAGRGRHDEAASLAQAAVNRVAGTEFMLLHAAARFWQAQVLRTCGDPAGASAAAAAALDLSRRKEDRATVRRIEAFLRQ